jgi:DNA-binding transcriptional LysR family regulator
MDTKKLEALATAVRLGSFTRAAEELGYTQSGLTHMMNSLEKDIGFPVLVRGRSGVKLTPAGERIFPLVQECLRASRVLTREIELVNMDKEETVRVGSYASVAMHWLPEIIQAFHRTHPGVDVDIQMGSVDDVYSWVREDKVDLGFVSWQENARLDNVSMEWTRLRDDPLLAILPRNYDMGGRNAFDVCGFEGQVFLMPSKGFHQDILRVMSRSGVTPVMRTAQVNDNVIISLVEHGLGLSILSELVLKGRRDDVQALPLDPAAARELGIISHPKRELRPVVRHFITDARDMIAKM